MTLDTPTFSPMHLPRWTEATRLKDWHRAPRSAGLYVVGIRDRPELPMGPPPDNEGKLGGLPQNLRGLYVGRSVDENHGVRDRLRKHHSGKGNRCIALHLRQGVEFWYTVAAGLQAAGSEALFLYLLPQQHFPFNLRPEMTRYLAETARALDAMGFNPSPAPYEDSVAPAGAISIEGIGRLIHARADCQFSR